MVKIKKIVKKVEPVIETIKVSVPDAVVPKVQPLTQEFGNGDMNILRDKINEIIKG